MILLFLMNIRKTAARCLFLKYRRWSYVWHRFSIDYFPSCNLLPEEEPQNYLLGPFCFPSQFNAISAFRVQILFFFFFWSACFCLTQDVSVSLFLPYRVSDLSVLRKLQLHWILPGLLSGLVMEHVQTQAWQNKKLLCLAHKCVSWLLSNTWLRCCINSCLQCILIWNGKRKEVTDVTYF